MKSIARKKGPKRAKPKAKVNAPATLAASLHGTAAQIDRAAGELRRGLPVVLEPQRGMPSLIASAELASAPLIAAMTKWAGAEPHVLLTHHRAATLKIRLYTDEIVAVPLPRDEPERAAQVLADPTRDMR